MSIYLDTDDNGSLLIDAAISDQVGQPLPINYTGVGCRSSNHLEVDILSDGVVIDKTSIDIGSTNVEVPLDLSRFAASLDGYNISIQATLGQGSTFNASTQVFRLPSPEGNSSVSRIDYLYGGLWVQRDNQAWQHIFPYTYYGKHQLLHTHNNC
jgi:hypothetical protein